MEDIVIAGISGRLPESNNLEEFWQNLFNGVDMVTEDDRRWKPGMLTTFSPNNFYIIILETVYLLNTIFIVNAFPKVILVVALPTWLLFCAFPCPSGFGCYKRPVSLLSVGTKLILSFMC